jgi:hypothetical protein
MLLHEMDKNWKIENNKIQSYTIQKEIMLGKKNKELSMELPKTCGSVVF